MFRILIATVVVALTGCSTIMCSGTGTCHKDANGSYITDPKYYVDNGYTDYRGGTSTTGSYNRGAVITTNSSTYVVVPSSSGSYPSAIIRSGGK